MRITIRLGVALLAAVLTGCERDKGSSTSATTASTQPSAPQSQPAAFKNMCLSRAVRPGDPVVDEARQALASGTMRGPWQGRSLRWVALRQLSDLTNDPQQHEFIRASAEDAFAKNLMLVAGRVGETYYILLDDDLSVEMTASTLLGAKMVLDDLGRPAIDLEFTSEGREAMARVANRVDQVAVVVGDQVIACGRTAPWICDQQQTAASEQRLTEFARAIDQHFRR